MKLVENRLGRRLEPKSSSQLRPAGDSSGNTAWSRETTQTRLGEGDLPGPGALWAPQVDTCVCAATQKSTALCSPCPASLLQPTPASQGRGSRHGDGFSGNQVKTTRGGGGVAITEIRTSHSPYLSLAGSRHTNTAGRLSRASSAVLYLCC